MTRDELAGELAAALGVQAYIWGFPLVEMVRTCARMTAVDAAQSSGRAPINQFGHSDHPWTHLDRDIVTPANDLLYSTAWLNLAQGPVLLSIPRLTGRYFVMAILDAYSNNFCNLGPRDVPADGWYLRTGWPRLDRASACRNDTDCLPDQSADDPRAHSGCRCH